MLGGDTSFLVKYIYQHTNPIIIAIKSAPRRRKNAFDSVESETLGSKAVFRPLAMTADAGRARVFNNCNAEGPVGTNPGKREAQPKQKFVKSYSDRLSPGAELPAKALETAKADKPATEKPVAAKPKSDKLTIRKLKPRETRTETTSRTPVQQRRPRVYIKEERERGDGIGEYMRRTDYGPPGWHRTHYYECADGRCDCSCDRPYWARSGPPCWD